MPQWWRVDLGEAHQLSSFAVSFQHPERTYTYLIETSQGDSVYVQQVSLSGLGAAVGGVSARSVGALRTNYDHRCDPIGRRNRHPFELGHLLRVFGDGNLA
jgi:hypothetical protein